MCSSHPLAQQQIDAVERVLKELDVESIPKLIVWNKVRFAQIFDLFGKIFNVFTLFHIKFSDHSHSMLNLVLMPSWLIAYTNGELNSVEVLLSKSCCRM